ncbi:hypothetical protein [Bradyrhizobium sp. CCBAU 051011]|nr:hypothetical protein [Bradyrhizobium sp. CCBAU 051011]
MPFPDSKSTAWEFFTDDDVVGAAAGVGKQSAKRLAQAMRLAG